CVRFGGPYWYFDVW
nr:immunoglobulin heavy chain junction region [Mus musculus]MBK4188074.1 immunoglobulin heavy chain junction region [Mus musculus]MBK4188075.1 immunoglobulin heavy chain junction region [Mus musculus]